ncbi:MAG: hypothetical protein UX89_C0006G0030 [Parcubacteria group bacterium GW2011_GWA2_47_16]|nr:MAG: hypothetical protein UX89_C0006G0030 [Parcubacteria group bacterium GW2011_GWA2_47_16]
MITFVAGLHQSHYERYIVKKKELTRLRTAPGEKVGWETLIEQQVRLTGRPCVFSAEIDGVLRGCVQGIGISEGKLVIQIQLEFILEEVEGWNWTPFGTGTFLNITPPFFINPRGKQKGRGRFLPKPDVPEKTKLAPVHHHGIRKNAVITKLPSGELRIEQSSSQNLEGKTWCIIL